MRFKKNSNLKKNNSAQNFFADFMKVENLYKVHAQ